MCVGVCACHVYTVRYHQKRTSDPLELELRVIVSPPVGVLGTELGSSVRAASSQMLSHLCSPFAVLFACLAPPLWHVSSLEKEYLLAYFTHMPLGHRSVSATER